MIDAALQNATAVTVCADNDAVGSNRIKYELIKLSDDIEQGLRCIIPEHLLELVD